MWTRNFYAYCLSEEPTLGAVDDTIGIGGSKAGLFMYDGFTTVVSRLEAASVAITRQNVSAHQRIIQNVLAETTPLPFRFGTIVNSVQLMRYVELHRAALVEALTLVRGAVEMGIKLSFRSGSGGARQAEVSNDAVSNGDTLIGSGPGARFLKAKQRKLVHAEVLKQRADEIGSWVNGRLADCVRSSSVRTDPVRRMTVSTAHLVERGGLDEYRRRVAEVRLERPDLHFLTSGPWPPYSFCDLKQ